MSKPNKKSQADSDEAFEMIELAINDINVLARAFELITAACNDGRPREESEEEKIPEYWLH